MLQLDPLRRYLASNRTIEAVYWCKQSDGTIVEHVATAYVGHDGHRQCIPIDTPEPS